MYLHVIGANLEQALKPNLNLASQQAIAVFNSMRLPATNSVLVE